MPSIALCLLLGGCNTKSKYTDSIASLCTSGALATSKGIDFLPTPHHREGIGNSHLTISTSHKDAQRWFDQGLNYLHGFWHLEAYRAFKEVIKYDSTCAMGYWGLAMCAPGFGGNEPIWQNSINKALKLSTSCTPFEKDLIDASAVLVNRGIAKAQTPFRNLYKKYPNQPEAIAFAAIMLRQHEDETTQQEVKQLLETSLKQYPNNAALMHYYIHVMELRPDFAKAFSVVEKMLKAGQNSPHLSHMPGHLYYLAGNYEKAAKIYAQTRTKELAYHKAENIPLSANQNYLHNLQFLAVAQAELNDYNTAFKTAKELSYITLSSKLPNAGAAQMLLYEGRILPALVAIRYWQWQDAEAELNFWLHTPDAPINNPMVRAYLQAMRAYVQGMASLLTHKEGTTPSSARGEVAMAKGAELTQLMQQFEKEAMPYQQTPEFKSINETYDILNMARFELAGWIDNLDASKPFNDTAWQEAIKLQNLIKYDEPPRLMYPIEESLMKLHLYRNDKQAALQAQKAALIRRPNSKQILELL